MKIFVLLLAILPIVIAIRQVKITPEVLGSLVDSYANVKFSIDKQFELTKGRINHLIKKNHTESIWPKDLMEEILLNLERIEGEEADVTQYADRLISNLSQLIIHNGFDPTELPDQTLGIVVGEITLSSGWLQDLSRIGRSGPASVHYSSSTKTLVMDVPIKFDSLMFTYDYHTHVVLLNIYGGAEGDLQNVLIDVQLSYNFETYQMKLNKFDMSHTGEITIKFTGNDLTDWILDSMVGVVTVFLKNLILGIIQSIIGGNLEKFIELVNQFLAQHFKP